MRPIELRGLRTAFIFIISFTLIAIMAACGGTSSTGQVHNYDELQNLISSRDFQIENDWANPSGGGNINLIGNPNFIRFSGDSVEVYLPYFGVRHAGAGYGREGGIKYKGPAEEFNITENADKKNIEVDFEGEQEGENLEFHIKLFANGSSFTSVNTSQRSTISYQGTVSRVEEE